MVSTVYPIPAAVFDVGVTGFSYVSITVAAEAAGTRLSSPPDPSEQQIDRYQLACGSIIAHRKRIQAGVLQVEF